MSSLTTKGIIANNDDDREYPNYLTELGIQYCIGKVNAHEWYFDSTLTVARSIELVIEVEIPRKGWDATDTPKSFEEIRDEFLEEAAELLAAKLKINASGLKKEYYVGEPVVRIGRS